MRDDPQLSSTAHIVSKYGSDMKIEHLEGTFLQFEKNGKKLIDVSK